MQDLLQVRDLIEPCEVLKISNFLPPQGPRQPGSTPHAVMITAGNIHSGLICFNRLSIAAEAFTRGPRLENPLALRIGYNAKLSAIGIEGLQRRSDCSDRA